MQSLTMTREIAAPAERTWGVVADIDRSAEVLSGVRRIERLAGSGLEVGTRWRETRTMMGREATEEMTVTAVDPGRSYRTEASSHGAHYLADVRVEGLEGGRSRLTFTFTGEPQSLMARIMAPAMGWMMARSVRKALAQDLEDVARAVEGATSPAS